MFIYYPASTERTPSVSRIHMALLQADLDSANPRCGVPLEMLHRKDTHSPDFIDAIIEENRDLWDRLLNHQFCLAMGKGTASLEGFKNYMVQDFKYLQNYVRFKLGVFQKADGWEQLKQAAVSIPADVNYAMSQLETCTGKLQIPEKDVLDANIHEAIREYCSYENLAAIEHHWFSLHVMMLPCIIGYSQIARKLVNDTDTDTNTLFYELWIKPNSEYSIQKYRDFCNINVQRYKSQSDQETWRRLFRTACEMEIDVFNIGLESYST